MLEKIHFFPENAVLRDSAQNNTIHYGGNMYYISFSKKNANFNFIFHIFVVKNSKYPEILEKMMNISPHSE